MQKSAKFSGCAEYEVLIKSSLLHAAADVQTAAGHHRTLTDLSF
ncbi:hypothetical protein ABEO83_04775 [Bacillus glycinifermentans]